MTLPQRIFYRLSPLRTLITGAGLALAILAIGGLLFALSGIYNVSARTGHWDVTRWLIQVALNSSVRTHSIGIDTPSLDDPNLVALGAGHFAGGCAPCHGAPGEPQNPIARSMLPAPPGLSHAAEEWEAEELFWIVQNGLKYTGMPAWPSPERTDEVWAMVAFLKRLPDLSAEDYRALAGRSDTESSAEDAHAHDFVPDATFSQALVACARCHDSDAAPAESQLTPRLAGQKVLYLEVALRDYASGLRPSGIMQAVAAELGDDAIRRLAAHYAEMASDNAKPDVTAQSATIGRGRRIAETSIPSERVPACLSCHREQSNPLFPRLDGQPARYLVNQLKLWKSGIRGRGTTTSAIMAPIAERLTEDQMADVAAFFASGGGRSSEELAEVVTRRPSP